MTEKAKKMVANFDAELKMQIGSRHYPKVNVETARHALWGFLEALKAVGLIDDEECFVLPTHFKGIQESAKE